MTNRHANKTGEHTKLQGHKESGPECFFDIAIYTVTIPLVCPMNMRTVFNALS